MRTAHRAVVLACATVVSGAVLTLGCRSVTNIDRSDWGAIPEYETIHVTTLDGTRTAVGSPVAYTGHLSGIRVDANGGDSVRIPLDSIEFVEVREFSVGKTLLIGVAAGTAIGIISAKGKSDVRPPPSSCPFVYSFDGMEYRLDSETFAGAVARGLERTDLDNLDRLRAVDGRFQLLLTNERPEVQYTDFLRLLVVDHRGGTRLVPDPEQRPRVLGPLGAARSARDFEDIDVLDLIRASDGRVWTGRPVTPDLLTAAFTELRDGVELTFIRPAADHALLLVEAMNTDLAPFALETFLELQGDGLAAWYRNVRRDTELRDRLRGWFVREGMLHVSVRVGGAWVLQDALPDVGPNLPKAQVARLDLREVSGDTVHVRLESARGLWQLDQVGLAEEVPGDLELHDLAPSTATDRDGFDRLHLLADEDERHHTAFPGDTVWVAYHAPPPPAPGRSRTVFVRSRGFYHLATDHIGRHARSDMAERILDEPRFGNRYILERWLSGAADGYP